MKVTNNFKWIDAMPILINSLLNSNHSAKIKKSSIKELMRLAKAVDAINGKTIIK